MLNTLGAIILAAQVTASITSKALFRETGLAKRPSSIFYQQNPVLVAVVDHYNNKGVWTGTFKIDRIVKFRIEKISEKQSIAHVKYFYTPVPNNAKGRTESGIDQRTFTFIENDDGITILKMGSHNSTKL